MNPIAAFLDAMRRFELAIREFEAKYDELITFHAAFGHDALQKGISSQILPLQHQLSRLLYSGESGQRQGSSPAQHASAAQTLRAMEDAWNIMEKFRSEAIELMQHIGRAHSHWIEDHSVQEMCAEIGIMWNSLEEFRSRVIGDGRQILPRLASPRSILPRSASPRPMSRMMSTGMAAARRSPTPPPAPMAVRGSPGIVQRFIAALDGFQIAFTELKLVNQDILTRVHQSLTLEKAQSDVKTDINGVIGDVRRSLGEVKKRLSDGLSSTGYQRVKSAQAKLEMKTQPLALMLAIRDALLICSNTTRTLMAAKLRASGARSKAVTDDEFEKMTKCLADMNKNIHWFCTSNRITVKVIQAMGLDDLFPRNPGSPR